jgi:hypothetical protein
MIIQLETCIDRFLYKLVFLKYFSNEDRVKILKTIKNQDIEFPGWAYDINKLLQRYYQMIGKINEKGLSHLSAIRNKSNFPEKKVIAALIIEKYCDDNCKNDYEIIKAIQVACTFVLQLSNIVVDAEENN